jgi:hypothetical protein
MGGLLGAGAILATWAEHDQPLLFLAVFGAVCWHAWRLWRGQGTADAMYWILVAQVPWFNWTEWDFHYEFFLLFNCVLRLGGGDEPIELGIGTRLQVAPAVGGDSAFCGVNLVALAFLVLLWRSGRNGLALHASLRPAAEPAPCREVRDQANDDMDQHRR